MTPARRIHKEPTIGEMFQRMLDRDEQSAKQTAYQSEQITNLGAVTQALQSELQRLVKLAERQGEINERQITLAEKTSEHAKTFDRAFGQMDKHKSDLSESIDKLSAKLVAFGDTVTGYRGSIGAIKWVIGVTIPMFLLLVGAVWSGVQRDLNEAHADAVSRALNVESRMAAFLQMNQELVEVKVQQKRLVEDVREMRGTRNLK